jgi:hypothetical protein
MPFFFTAAFIAFSGLAFAQSTPVSPAPAIGAAAESKPGTPAATSPATPGGAARGKGRVTATPAQTAAAKEAALDAQAKKAREEQERRIKERDRKLEGLMKSICRGC